MEALKFKTNINCSGCVAAVTPFLNKEKNIEKWQVDIQNPDKILTVEGNTVKKEEVLEAVEKAGYKITPL
ncbi:MAG: heavy-metal-associated domain-containing protein [Bacteroidota bacterium]|nr:heavy-metal-associated domain-containing protein [Bacteroidota bacterium]